MFEHLQLGFVLAVIGILLFLVLNALVTGSVWVKGARSGWVNLKEFAHKRDRNDDPLYYWGHLLFYTAGILFLLYLLLKQGA